MALQLYYSYLIELSCAEVCCISSKRATVHNITLRYVAVIAINLYTARYTAAEGNVTPLI